ncbi:MAG: rhodanese-like domain-containing protein [Siphonobacter sp.]
MASITPEEFKKRLEQEELNILDIRTPYERDDFSVGGLAIPMDELLLRINEIPDNWKQKEVIVICGTGMQSAIATRILGKRGFEHPRNLDGGLVAYLGI